MRQNRVVRGAATRAAGFEQRGLEPAAMLIRAFEIQDFVLAAVAQPVDAREARKVFWIVQREGMG